MISEVVELSVDVAGDSAGGVDGLDVALLDEQFLSEVSETPMSHSCLRSQSSRWHVDVYMDTKG